MARLSIRALLAFYDGAVSADRAHSNAINAMLGEELGLGLLLAHLRATTGGEVAALDDPCTQGTSKGARLDRWVRVVRQGEAILYQVEIKNWCAHSLGGRPLAIDVDGEVVRAHAVATWKRYWDDTERRPADEPLQKVLVPMQAPLRFRTDPIEPVACVWDLLSPTGTLEPWFSVPASGAMKALHWFSMSAYLRSLLVRGQSEIELAMPTLEARLALIGRMVLGGRDGDRP